MLRKTKCLECEEVKANCVELGGDDNYVCLDCIKFTLDLYNVNHKRIEYEVRQNFEKIDPNNVPF